MELVTQKFGGVSPYWVEKHLSLGMFYTAQQAIQCVPEEERIVDPVGVMELLQFNYMCGSRTLIQGVKRMPWRSMLDSDGVITRRQPVAHGTINMHAAVAAKKLCALLTEELLGVIEKHKRTYLLLTGGLDSRLIAGLLYQARAEINSEITAVTWGSEDSRDVQYAKKIAGWFGWDFVHIPLDAETVWNNIECMATWGGAEVSGLHLHAMNWFNNITRDDLVIAASFGDSVGRAEFSGKHVLQLNHPQPFNPNGLVHPFLEDSCLHQSTQDIATAWALLEDAPDYVKLEHHQQENYMRRMICHAMDRIRVNAHLHQAFTSDSVVSFMWSLCPLMRDNKIYFDAFKQLDNRLYTLPWARTGVAPDGFTAETNSLLQHEYHSYGSWCKHELRSRLESHAFANDLYKLGFLYAPNWNRLYHSWKRNSGFKHFGVVEDITKLAQIDIARQKYGLQPIRKAEYIRDRFRGVVWPVIQRLRTRTSII